MTDYWSQYQGGAKVNPAAPAAPADSTPSPVDPWSKYRTPQSATPPPAAAPTGDVTDTSQWFNPLTHSLSENWARAKAAANLQIQGTNQAAQDYARTAVDAATFGLGDRAQSYLTGNTVDEERKLTQQSRDRLGAMAPIVEGAMYAFGPGELGIAGRTADLIAPEARGVARWASGVAGSAAEGAASGAAGAAGHGEDIGLGALYGLAGGAAGGTLGGVAGQKAAPAVTKTAQDFDQLADRAYTKMDQVTYNPSMVGSMMNIGPLRKGQQGDLSDAFEAAVAKQQRFNLNGAPTSANDIDDFARNIRGAVNTKADSVASAQIGDNLKSLLQGAPTTSGHAPGYASTLQDAANQAIGQRNDLNRITNWQDQAATAGGPDVAKQAGDWLRTQQGQKYAPPGSDLYTATNELAGTPTKAGYIPYWMKHYVMAPVAGLAAGEGLAMATGDENSPLTRVAEDIAMASALGGGGHAYSGLTRASRTGAQNRAINALRSTIESGGLQTPPNAASPIGQFIRNLWGGQMASGGLGQSQ